MAQDGAKVRTTLGQTMGPPLAHANPMAIALAAHQQLQTRNGSTGLHPPSQRRGRRDQK